MIWLYIGDCQTKEHKKQTLLDLEELDILISWKFPPKMFHIMQVVEHVPSRLVGLGRQGRSLHLSSSRPCAVKIKLILLKMHHQDESNIYHTLFLDYIYMVSITKKKIKINCSPLLIIKHINSNYLDVEFN